MKVSTSSLMSSFVSWFSKDASSRRSRNASLRFMPTGCITSTPSAFSFFSRVNSSRRSWITCSKDWFLDDVMTWKRFSHYWPFYGESTPHRWITLAKGHGGASLIISLCLSRKKLLNTQSTAVWDALRMMGRHFVGLKKTTYLQDNDVSTLDQFHIWHLE